MNRPIAAPLGPYCVAPIPGGCDRLRGHRRLCDAHRKQKAKGQPFRPLLLPHGKLLDTRCRQCRRPRNIRGAYCSRCKSAWYRAKRKAQRRSA